jgi:hypothetical protein
MLGNMLSVAERIKKGGEELREGIYGVWVTFTL